MTTITDTPVNVGRFARRAAAAGLVGALLQIGGGILESVDRVRAGEPGFAFRTALIGIAYLLLGVSVVGLMQSRLSGSGLVPRWALGIAAAGWILSAVAQFVLPADTDLAQQVLFPTATVLIGLGMTVAGIAALRAGRLRGWSRVGPIACGLYPFVVAFPVFAATGGPQFLVLSGWGPCWLILNAVVYQQPRA
jgi:hypothetical protein